MIRLLLVDDHAVVRAGFAALLSMEPDFSVVGAAGTGADAVRMFRTLQPDVTLMDLCLPDIDGGAAIRAIRSQFPDARIAVLTTYDNDERILSALRSGACTYLIKTLAADDLCRSIRDVAAGRVAAKPLSRDIGGRGHLAHLTERELEVLEQMVAGLPNEAIGAQLGVSINTIKSHARTVQHKLGAKSRTEAVAQAVARGIVKAASRR